MDHTDSPEDEPDEPQDDHSRAILVTDWKIGSSGRLTIPKPKRERYGLQTGDYVVGVLVPEPEGDDTAVTDILASAQLRSLLQQYDHDTENDDDT